MVTYEFECPSCGKVEECRRSYGDTRPPLCQPCGLVEMRYKWNAPNVYGQTKFCDSAFASEKIALGHDIRSVKDIDARGVRAVGDDSNAYKKN